MRTLSTGVKIVRICETQTLRTPRICYRHTQTLKHASSAPLRHAHKPTLFWGRSTNGILSAHTQYEIISVLQQPVFNAFCATHDKVHAYLAVFVEKKRTAELICSQNRISKMIAKHGVHIIIQHMLRRIESPANKYLCQNDVTLYT